MTTDVNQAFCHTDNYSQVYFDTNRLIRETFTGDEYPAPAQLHVVKQA